MADPVVTTSPGRARSTVTWCLAWSLVAGCLLLVATMFVAGARLTPYDDLRTAVAAGQVDEIRVAGGLDDDVAGDGYALAEVHWRDGLVPRVTRVYESTRKHQFGGIVYSGDAPTVHGLVDHRLAALDPDLHTTRAGELGSLGSGFSIRIGAVGDRGWQLPGWTGLLGLALVIGTLGLLIGGPEPRRATRWAWFWLLWLAPPLGTLAFLLLGGSTSRRPRPPRTPDQRLTGGWAFLLAVVLGSALGFVASVVL